VKIKGSRKARKAKETDFFYKKAFLCVFARDFIARGDIS
jgi:hypothetical protein